MAEIKLVVGLGNPGAEYASTRHNAGFMAAARLLERLNGAKTSVSRYESEIFTARFRGRSILVQMPTTYMNCSGAAVRKLMTAQGILPGELLVVHDDLDLPFGKLRLRESGSAGGHHGVESVMAEIGSEQFGRLRVGIGSPEAASVVDYVLSPFPAEAQAELDLVIRAAADAALLALARGMKEAMNRYNRWNLESEIENKKQAGPEPETPTAAM
ncbi:MAG: aminoacyl-tRNA hydrolase [Victivallaceae bacterium]|nr:aminoacyl-tRNA hydrolase [Victivallaceae bacterium]